MSRDPLSGPAAGALERRGTAGEIRAEIGNAYIRSALFFLTSVGLFLVLLDYLVTLRAHATIAQLVVLDSGTLLGTAYLSYLAINAIAYSISLTDDGISVLQQGILIPGQRDVPPITIRWREIHGDVYVRGVIVSFDTDRTDFIFGLTPNQARAVFSDPRCPLYGRLPEDVARGIGIEVRFPPPTKEHGPRWED